MEEMITVTASLLGRNSRANAMCHEMSVLQSGEVSIRFFFQSNKNSSCSLLVKLPQQELGALVGYKLKSS